MIVRLLCVLFLLSPLLSFAEPAPTEPVEVRLEPFPPLVNSDGTGLAVDLLQLVAAHSDLAFSIQIMPYSRAKFQLRNAQAELIGPVPLGMESHDFYEYAHELDWRLETHADLYVIDEELLVGSALPGLQIGVPFGNAEFFAELTDLPVSQFTESSLVNLVQMLARGRIDALLFERASTFRTLQAQNVVEVHYKRVFSIPAGFAVRDDAAGRVLAEKLDAALERLDYEPLLETYREYLSLPDQGRVDAGLIMVHGR